MVKKKTRTHKHPPKPRIEWAKNVSNPKSQWKSSERSFKIGVVPVRQNNQTMLAKWVPERVASQSHNVAIWVTAAGPGIREHFGRQFARADNVEAPNLRNSWNPIITQRRHEESLRLTARGTTPSACVESQRRIGYLCYGGCQQRPILLGCPDWAVHGNSVFHSALVTEVEGAQFDKGLSNKWNHRHRGHFQKKVCQPSRVPIGSKESDEIAVLGGRWRVSVRLPMFNTCELAKQMQSQ